MRKTGLIGDFVLLYSIERRSTADGGGCWLALVVGAIRTEGGGT